MPRFLNRAKMTTATTGTGTITLGSVSSNFQSFAAAGLIDGETVRYTIEDGTAWEIGTGVYTSSGTTLSRTLTSSSTGSLLSLTGSAVVFGTVAAEDLTTINAGDGTVSFPSYTFDSDKNTGVYRPSTDAWAIVTGGTERVRVDSSGLVGIGTNSHNKLLHVYRNNTDQTAQVQVEQAGTGSPTLGFLKTGVAAYLTGLYNSDNSYRIASSGTDLNTNTRFVISSAGAVTINNLSGTGTRTVTATSTGVLAAASDSRLKQEVPEASIAGLAEIMQLRPVAYKWLTDIEDRGDDAAVELGFFADEAKNIIPSAAPMGSDGYYGFYDRAVIAALTKAVQEQQQMIQALQADVAALKMV